MRISRFRRSGGVAVRESDAGVFRERRVVDLERRGRVVEVLHRRVELARLGVVEDEVAL